MVDFLDERPGAPGEAHFAALKVRAMGSASRTLEVAELTLSAIRQAVARNDGEVAPEHPPVLAPVRVAGQRNVLDAVDLTARVEAEDYLERLPARPLSPMQSACR